MMDIEEIRRGLETGNMIKPEKTFLLITMTTSDGPLYYVSEGGNGRPETETQWTTEPSLAARFDRYEDLPGAISNGQLGLRIGTYGNNIKLGLVYPYDTKIENGIALAFKWKTRKW
jgi:hypothetical protein